MPEDKKKQLHWSQISMYTKCGEQFRRRYIEGEVLPPGVGAATGKGFHKAIEIDLTRKIETGDLAPEEEVTEAARDNVVKSFDSDEGVFLNEDEIKEGISAVKSKAIDEAVTCASLHHKELAPLTRPQEVEKKWVLTVNNFPFDLGGTIDCDDGDTIWDWKTAKKSPVATEADNSGQITMYSLAKMINSGTNIIPTAKLAYVVKLKTPKTMILETRRTTDDFVAMRCILERVAEGIEKEVFPFASSMAPRPWWCHSKWCGYYSTCAGVNHKTVVSVPEGKEIYV